MTSTALQSTDRPTEVMPLAREISQAVGRHVDVQVRQFETSPDDCLGELSQPTENHKERALSCEPSQFTWMDFHALNQTDPGLGWGQGSPPTFYFPSGRGCGRLVLSGSATVTLDNTF